MGHKSKRNKSVQHPPRNPKPVPMAQETETERYARELEAIFQRKDQATIFQELVERHKGDIPVPELWQCRAIRLQGEV